MSNVVRTDIDSVNAVLTVTIPKEEYLNKVQQDIKKYSQKAPMKGFRPGKTPPTLVKKMYGQQFLMDAVNDKVQEHLNTYLQAEKMEMLGQPIPSSEQDKFDLDLKNPQDLTFKFDIGLTPQFELKGLEGVSYERYAIQLDEKMVTDELEKALKGGDANEEVEGVVQENDVITLKIKEVGGTLENEVAVSTNWMTEDMNSVFLTQSKGDTLTINIFQLEKETTPQYVRKYFLGLEETDEREVNENFHATIIKIMRAAKPEMNEDFFQKNFGVATEDEARQNIIMMLGQNYESQADALLLRDFQDRLMKESAVQLPDTFLKRWLKTQNKDYTDDLIDKDYDRFADNMRWSLIRSKILKDNNIEITHEEVRAYYANKIRGYFGGMPLDDSFIGSLVDKAMDDEKQFNDLYEDVMTGKVFNTMKSTATLINKPISVDEFNSVMATARFEASKSRGEISEVEPAEEVEA